MTSKLMDKLFAVWNAELTSRPLAFHAKNPITKPEIIIPMFPIPLYPWVNPKIMAWRMIANNGMLNHDPKVCTRSPRNTYS